MAASKLVLYGFVVSALIQFSLCSSLGPLDNETKTEIQPEPEHDEDFVPLDELPDPFIQEKLPGAETDTDWCDSKGNIGCFKSLAGLPTPEQPEEMKAAFNVISGEQKVLIEYKPTKHCLKSNSSICMVYPYNLGLIGKSNFNPELRTIIVVPGFKSGQFDQFQIDIAKGWADLDNVNFIMVAWTGGNDYGRFRLRYPRAAANTKVVARQISVLLYYFGLLKSGYQLTDDIYVNQVSMIGHSLGAHISGFVGKDLEGGLGSIVGLDPAKPNFMHMVARARLDRSDALLVQTIHSNTALWGIPEAIGSLDFYANEGTEQPGCGFFDATCSHSRSHQIYISLLKHEKRIRDLGANSSLELENHKLYGYQSADYRKFIDGSSRRRLCPKSVLDDKTFDRSDINNCITPMDFVTEPEKAIENLKSYGIDVFADKSAGKSRKLYFHTQEEPSYLNNHFMFKIYFAEDRKPGSECKIDVDVMQSDGKVKNYNIGYYSLYENEGHLEANIPIMGSNLESKYALAEVDANDYYTGDLELLERKAKVIFPNSIRIKGSMENRLDQSSNSTQDPLFDWCSLQIESVHMEPLNKLNRYFSASFSVAAKGKKYPDIVFQQGASSLREPRRELVQLGAVSDAFLDVVVVGPSRIPGVTVFTKVTNARSDYATLASASMIFICLVSALTLATVASLSWWRRSRNAPDTQPIITPN